MDSIRRISKGFLKIVSNLSIVMALMLFGPAQAQEKAIRIGILSSGNLEARGGLEQSLLRGLKEKGYVEGRNLFVERRYASDDLQQIPQFARELAAMKLDGIVTTCTPTTRIAKQATLSMPIIMATVSDPVGQGLIASLAKPGGNITGRSSQAEDLLGKRLALMAELLPKATTIAVLASSRNPVHALDWERLKAPAQQMNLKLLRFEVAGPADIPVQIEAAAAARAQALFVMPDDPLLYNKHVLIVQLAAKHRLPDFYWTSDYVDDGGLMSYGENLGDSYSATAEYILKVARGGNPAEIPVAQPTQFQLVINRRTSKALGLAIPQSLLVRADRVIE